MATLQLVAVPDSLKSRHFSRGDLVPLWHNALWKIEEGVVRTLTWGDEGTLIALGYWGAGEIIGQPLSRLNPYQIECLTSVTVSLIPAGQWPQELDRILFHVQQMEELHSFLQTQRTDERLLNFLIWLAKKFGCPVEDGTLINLRLTHLEISNAIGTTRVSVTRMMTKLEQRGIILRPRRHCVILKSTVGLTVETPQAQ